jgi:uncharacterized protein (DUF2147 family)
MLRTCLIAFASFWAGQASAAPVSPLLGVWAEVNGPGMARLAPCPRSAELVCATGLSRNSAGKVTEKGLVLTDVRLEGANRWRGTYHDGSRKLPATLRMAGPNQVQMKVCLLVICQTATYARAR